MTEKGASVLCPISPTVQLARMADIHIDNIYHDVDKLFMQMTRLRITDAERLRPSWDSYFMLLADLAARRSNCMKRRVGCIIVCDRRVLATGYNGTPRGILNCNKGGCERCNRGSTRGTALDECICLHAEENAIMELGVSRVQNNTTLYCNTYPCLGCAKRIVQVGIREVVYYHTYGTNKTTIALFEAAGVYTRRHHPMAPHHSFIEDDSMS
jgi:dCMP deaminase